MLQFLRAMHMVALKDHFLLACEVFDPLSAWPRKALLGTEYRVDNGAVYYHNQYLCPVPGILIQAFWYRHWQYLLTEVGTLFRIWATGTICIAKPVQEGVKYICPTIGGILSVAFDGRVLQLQVPQGIRQLILHGDICLLLTRDNYLYQIIQTDVRQVTSRPLLW